MTGMNLGDAPAGDNPASTPSSMLRGNRAGLLLAVLAGFGLVVPGILIPAFSRIFIDNILVDGKAHWMVPLLTAMFAVMLVRVVLTWLQRSVLLTLETRYALIASSRIFNHLLRLPMAFYFGKNGGALGSRVELTNRIAKLVAQETAAIGLQLLLALFYCLAMFIYSPLLGLVGTMSGVASFGAVLWSASARTELSSRWLEHRERLVGMGTAGIQCMPTIKATAGEQDFFNRWDGLRAEAGNAFNRLQRKIRILETVPVLFADLGAAAVLGFGALSVMRGEMTMGEVVAVMALQVAFTAPVREIVQFLASFKTVGSSLERIDDVLVQKEDSRFIPENEKMQRDKRNRVIRLAGRFEMDQVTFGYSTEGTPVLENISLSLEPGARVAVVGKTGSGKSTLANLAAGLYEPQSGRILHDGLPTSAIDPVALSMSRGYVNQEMYLFEGSVRDNISMWNPALPEQDIIRAAKDACIHEEISARPGGYDAPVSEAGKNFSGGQRQRLEIAKALAVNPSLLILDEATSALDPTQEQQIDENLRRRGVTCLIFAHRLSTIRDSDEIVVLDRGRIVERGTPRELYAAGGLYTKLVEQ